MDRHTVKVKNTSGRLLSLKSRKPRLLKCTKYRYSQPHAYGILAGTRWTYTNAPTSRLDGRKGYCVKSRAK